MWFLVSSAERISRKAALVLCMIYVLFVLQQVGVHLLF
jgi:hypothetical protein